MLCGSGPPVRKCAIPSSAEIGIAVPSLNASARVIQSNRTLAHPRRLLLWVQRRLEWATRFASGSAKTKIHWLFLSVLGSGPTKLIAPFC